MLDIGQKPILLNREIGGFAVNRVQYAKLFISYGNKSYFC